LPCLVWQKLKTGSTRRSGFTTRTKIKEVSDCTLRFSR
jgi:hypothetical protein